MYFFTINYAVQWQQTCTENWCTWMDGDLIWAPNNGEPVAHLLIRLWLPSCWPSQNICECLCYSYFFDKSDQIKTACSPNWFGLEEFDCISNHYWCCEYSYFLVVLYKMRKNNAVYIFQWITICTIVNTYYCLCYRKYLVQTCSHNVII